MAVSTISKVRDWAFAVGVGFLFTHELDAVPNHEWRGLPLLGGLDDATARAVFIAAHVPLFAVIVMLTSSARPRLRRWSRGVVGAFLVVHGVLHVLSMHQPTYEFSSTLSNVLIFGGAACGALYLSLALRSATPAGRAEA